MADTKNRASAIVEVVEFANGLLTHAFSERLRRRIRAETRELAEFLHARGIAAEAGPGCINGIEDTGDLEGVLTTPKQIETESGVHLVLHGADDFDEELFKECVKRGIAKCNVNDAANARFTEVQKEKAG
ncbi:hypothetical protein GGS23DRAFT_591912 [Durotheca rogersii]|uniref:uncharacterized protein n=1 Tax=Durotheca rogersii TaxID=419775 RepID=UPI00221EA66E|nr:uncharacterized protein GGS23DRAFT_591912 [Durotheca rogersii]KAI5868109.1 hypothetical protein GGS23DRAFT_591912 [Durotheca rogersii]